jgi:hypothetical protein
LGVLRQVTWGIHMIGHEGGHGGGASLGDLKLSGVMLGEKEKVVGNKVENQKLGPESLHPLRETPLHHNLICSC